MDVQPVKFGKYILLDRIAVGGMAELYRAKITGAKGFEKLIAIKKILPNLTIEDNLINAFIDEAKLAAFLQHQNIVQIYDFGKMENTYFIAMEYLLGKDLRFVIKKSEQTGTPLGLENALHITARICDGLNYAHNLKDFHGQPLHIIHRDIGPHNIFITYDGQVKVIDFGIAKAASQSTNTQEGLIKGKVAYMSPEQARGQHIDHRTDIYSIGILLYELVTHKRMFVGDTLQIYAKACKGEFEPPEEAAKDLPAELYAILNRTLAKDPEERYQSADEMSADLDRCISALSFRPTARSLSRDMTALFEQESKTEEFAMREAALYDPSAVPESFEKPAGQSKKAEPHDAASSQAVAGEKKRGVLLYLVIGLALCVVGWISTRLFVNEPANIASNGNAVSLPVPDSQEADPALTVPLESRPVETASVPKPTSSIRRKISTAPGPEPIDLTEGQRLLDEKRFDQAVAFFENILKNEPAIKDRIDPLYARALQGQATAIETHDWEKARGLLLKSLEAAPDNAAGHYQLGRLYTRQKDYSNAITSYQRAVELDPEMAVGFFNLGYIYYSINKDYVRAYDMYQRAVDLTPSFLDEALYNLALVQNKTGKRREAIKSLERAVSVNKDNQQVKKFLDYLKRKAK